MQQAEGAAAVVGAMRLQLEVKRAALQALVALSYGDDVCKGAVVASGGLEHVLESMRNHPDDARLVQLTCGVLANLANSQNSTLALSVLRAGAVYPILRVMGLHKADSTLQGDACLALSNLACLAEGKIPVCNASGHKALVTALKEHGETSAGSTVRLWGCTGLANIASGNTECLEALLAANVVTRIITVMMYALENQEFAPLLSGCNLFSSLASIPAGLQEVCDAGGVTVTVRCIAVCADPKLAVDAMRALGMIVFTSDFGCGLGRQAGGAEAVSKALEYFSDVRKICDMGPSLLQQLTR